MSSQRTRIIVPMLAGSLLLLGCGDVSAPTALAFDTDPAAARAGLVCVAVETTGSNPLGFIPAGLEGAGGLGGMPGPFTVGDIEGQLHSYITSGMPVPVGASGRGATHITLRHIFMSADGGFYTDDVAVCAPNPNGPGTCRLSDQMTVAGGTGVFEGATGKLHNRGVLDFNIYMLTFELTGTVCASGL